MKTIAKILFVTLLTLGAVSCTQAESTDAEVELYGPDGDDSNPSDGKD
ncbi:MAG: hypothetical protein AAF039_00765 [Bacteroidota bacterium]